MTAKYYFNRIINNKLKLGVILIIFMLPVVDVLLLLNDIHNGSSVLEPNLASFLSSTIFNGAQILLFWFLPLYFLLLAADDCIQDFKTGYRNILITRLGKNKYFFINIIKGFAIGFTVIFLSLALNMLMTQIAFAGGAYSGFDENDSTMKEIFKHPFLTNCIYILAASFISGFVSIGSVAAALALHSRYIAYPLVFLLWYIPSSVNKSIILALQPFTEYSLLDVFSTILFVIGINIALVIFAYVKVVRFEQV